MATNNITVPPSPDISMGLKLQVTVGRNQVQRNTGTYAALYLAPNSNLNSAYVELAPAQVYTVSASVKNLVVSTSSQLTFSGVLANAATANFKINSLFELDDSF